MTDSEISLDYCVNAIADGVTKTNMSLKKGLRHTEKPNYFRSLVILYVVATAERRHGLCDNRQGCSQFYQFSKTCIAFRMGTYLFSSINILTICLCIATKFCIFTVKLLQLRYWGLLYYADSRIELHWIQFRIHSKIMKIYFLKILRHHCKKMYYSVRNGKIFSEFLLFLQ